MKVNIFQKLSIPSLTGIWSQIVGSISMNPRLSGKMFPQFLLNFKNSNPKSLVKSLALYLHLDIVTGSQLSTPGRKQV
jgi:hypothetical protein